LATLEEAKSAISEKLGRVIGPLAIEQT